MPSAALTLTMTGTVLVVLAWLLLGRFAIGRRDPDGNRAG